MSRAAVAMLMLGCPRLGRPRLGRRRLGHPWLGRPRLGCPVWDRPLSDSPLPGHRPILPGGNTDRRPNAAALARSRPRSPAQLAAYGVSRRREWFRPDGQSERRGRAQFAAPKTPKPLISTFRVNINNNGQIKITQYIREEKTSGTTRNSLCTSMRIIRWVE